MSNILEDIIRQHISLPSMPNPNGWFQVVCKVCNDHGRKGERGGFKFDGNVTGYNCFNCGHHATYDSTQDEDLSKGMKKVLRGYSIPESDWGRVLYEALANRTQLGVVVKPHLTVDYEPSVIPLPKFFYQLSDDPSDEMSTLAIQYLQDRNVNWKSNTFYLSKLTNHPNSQKWYGRLIIPAYKDHKLIFYQGRDMSGTRIKKYESPSTSKDCVLSNFEFLNSTSRDEPLYIQEGWFDSYHVNGVAVFGRHLTPQHVYWLNKTPRPKVIIPDKYGDGIDLARAGLQQGWSVSIPDINDCKDIDDAVKKYGKLYVLNTLRENTCSGFEANVKLGIYCE